MLWIGGALLLLGWVLAFLGVLHVIPQSFLLAFASVVCMILGTVLGMFGAFGIYRANRRD